MILYRKNGSVEICRILPMAIEAMAITSCTIPWNAVQTTGIMKIGVEGSLENIFQ